MTTCMFGQCINVAEFYGPVWSGLFANDTSPSYMCVEHADELAIVRVIGFPVNDQPPGFGGRAASPSEEGER